MWLRHYGRYGGLIKVWLRHYGGSMGSVGAHGGMERRYREGGRHKYILGGIFMKVEDKAEILKSKSMFNK